MNSFRGGRELRPCYATTGVKVISVLVLGTIFPFLAPAATGPVAVPTPAR